MIRAILSILLVILILISIFGPVNDNVQVPVLLASTVILIILMFRIAYEEENKE